jgi:hypothetical protein
MQIDIYYNANGSGDWMHIQCGKDVLYAGHSISAYHVAELLRNVVESAVKSIDYHEVTDEEIQQL